MDLRRVFLPTYYFPPSAASASFRLLGFARHLPKHGWCTDVLFPGPLGWEPNDPALRDQVPAEVHIEVVPFPTNRVVGKLANQVLGKRATYDIWLPRAWRGCQRMVRERRPSAVFTSGPPHHVHFLGLGLKRRHGLPWIADLRDPWITGAELAGGGMARSRRSEAWLERAVFRSADAIIMNAPNAAASVRSAYPAFASKVHVITNGYDQERFSGPFDPPGTDGPLTIVHPGQVYAGRDPWPFLEAVRDLIAGRPPGSRAIRVEFIGRFGSSRPGDPGAEADRLGLGSAVAFLDQVPYAEALARMRNASILLLLDSPGRLVGVPAKLYEYIGAGRPVLALGEAGSDTAWVLTTSGVPHRVAPADDPAAIRAALANLVAQAESMPAQPLPSHGPGPFTREALAGRLAEVLDAVSGRTGRSGPES